MHANALRRILLVESVEDQDADGSVLTPAEREAATRAAVRAQPAVGGAGPAAHEARAWRVLDARAAELYERLVARHPVVARTVMLESHATQAAAVLLLVAFVAGVALSLIDSRVRIEIVAFPLLGLVLWNLGVYVALALAALRRASPRAADTGAGWLAWPLRWGWRRAAALTRQAAFHHRPLAAALRRYSEAWWPLARPLLALQGRRLFHAAAATVALGLVAGFYVRGVGLEYRAGWESTFLSGAQVQGLLRAIYGPASAVTGIALPPDAAAIDALRWQGGTGGGPAAPWIHLIAVTALLYVVLPRALLALKATIELARASRAVVPPDSLLPYARGVLGGSDAAPRAVTLRVAPYAYRPDTASLEGLSRLLQAAFGPGTRFDLAAPLAYGAEEQFAGCVATPDGTVPALLFTLASTPETENHGALLVAARAALADAPAPARLLVLVDEAPYLAHMRGDATLGTRIEQRREAWRTFVAHHGLEPCSVDLAAIAAGEPVTDAQARQLRVAAGGARA